MICPFKRFVLFVLLFVFIASSVSSQQYGEFTRQDTLRGSVTPEREWWDLTFYHLNINTNPADSTIEGYVLIRYDVLKPHNLMQVDLQPP
ncbi:MAG TPA: hypothetical protein VJ877_01880, partial [Bacteroidales bacterium]|nr:hypothetical protein [Bacteroidales bacterium]